MPQALAWLHRRRSSIIRSGVRATSMPPLCVNTPSSLYCAVLSSVSSNIIFEYSIGKTKLDACPVEPPGLGIGPLSTRTRSRQPSRARWWTRLLPTMPAPMMTALARSGVSLIPLNTAHQSFPSPLPDTGPAAEVLAAGPVPSPVRTLRLLDRDLLVDEAQVDPLPPAHNAGDHIQHDRQHVHRPHVDERLRVVHEVVIVDQPRDQAEDEQPDGDHPGDRDDWHPEQLDLAGRRRAPQVRLEPGQQHHRDRAE